MKKLVALIAVGSFALVPNVHARSYVPLSISAEPDRSAPAENARSIRPESRPYLPGLRPLEVELLEDVLRRKRPISVGNSVEKAHDAILRNALRDPVKRGHIKGELAEAMFLQRNPEWGYVRSGNAPEVDVYRWVASRTRPEGAQIKTHASSNPATYARDMAADRKANFFLVPDDHVEELRDYWRSRIREFEERGLSQRAADARGQLARIGGLGFTAKELDASLSRAAQHIIRERSASYISLGAASAVVLGPLLWDFLQGEIQADELGYHATRAGAVLGAERLSSRALHNWKSGALRGSWRGNAVVGTSLLVVDTAFAIYENGGRAAFRSADFYANLSGSVSSIAVMWKVGPIVTMAVTRRAGRIHRAWGTGAGVALGIGTALLAGTVTYFGGREMGLVVLESVDPDFLYDQERLAVSTAKENLEGRIRLLQGQVPL